jgi:hypothetical protein
MSKRRVKKLLRTCLVFTTALGEKISNAKADWHVRLKTKYQTAADNPFLPVAPDPPEPE